MNEVPGHRIGDALPKARQCPMCGADEIDRQAARCTNCGEQLPWSVGAIHRPANRLDSEFIRRFRRATMQLGVAWIVCGLSCIGFGFVDAIPTNSHTMPMLIGLGGLTVVSGILTTFRSIPAIFAGLLASLYLFVFAIPFTFGLEWSSLIFVVGYATLLAQAIRIIERARAIRRAGYGLDTLPDEVDID